MQPRSFILSLFMWLIPLNLHQTLAQTAAEELLQQGKVAYDRADYSTAISKLQQAEKVFTDKRDLLNTAATLGNLSLAYQQLGKLELATKSIDTSLDLLQPTKNFDDRDRQLLIYTQSLQIKGRLAWLQAQREREKSTTNDEARLPWQCPDRASRTIGTTFDRAAMDAYKQAIEFAPNPQLKTSARVNYLNLLAAKQLWREINPLWHQIDLTQLPPSKTTIYARINLAKNLYCWYQAGLASATTSIPAIEQILTKTIDQARQLGDESLTAYTLGNVGGFYFAMSHDRGRVRQEYLQTSERLTRQALLLAQPINAPDLAYQWQWQLGKIYAIKGQNDLAIVSYIQAVNTLKIVRNDLLSTDANLQFSFRDNVEPVYRELVNLLVPNEQNSQPNLQRAIDTIDALQLAELQNFLRCDLSQNISIVAELERTKSKAALIYPIVLTDRIIVIAKLPGKPLVSYQTQVDRATVTIAANTLRKSIVSRNTSEIIATGKTIYQWTIAPLAKDLAQNNQINQLVFVLDGALRNIPVGVLYDAKTERYLIEQKYALSVLPTTQLLDLRPFQFKQARILAAGVSEGFQNIEQNSFAPLNISELQSIGADKILLNDRFTQTNIQQELKTGDFSIVHIATHGQFSSNADNTYLLAYKQLLHAQDLDRILRTRKLDLLVLSACETATGDKRATLGLAGLSLRAGANSTLSTLWQINDDSTSKLMTEFYRQMKGGNVTKAEALHLAQQKLLAQPEYQNPYFWGAYVLIGNWL